MEKSTSDPSRKGPAEAVVEGQGSFILSLLGAPMACRRRRRRRLPPARTSLSHRDLRLVKIDGKGLGVIACHDLPPNARLEYVGRTIGQAAFKRLCQRAKRNRELNLTAYLIAEGRSGFFINADPRLPERNVTWIAARVNEPAPGETANAIIGRQLAMTEDHHRRLRPVLITVRTVKAGEELTVKYGRACTRTYTIGRAPKKPTWL
jgi:hypothetical protein